MPPFVGRKRRSVSPLPEPAPVAKKARTSAGASAKAPPRLQKKLSRFTVDSSTDSSLSDLDSDEFEDVPKSTKTSKGKGKAAKAKQPEPQDESDEHDEEMWEDAPAPEPTVDLSTRQFKDINISMQNQPAFEPTESLRRGPSKKERQKRLRAHQMHVQLLLWHNAKRNEWLNDKRLHELLLKQLPAQLNKEVEKWRRASGLASAMDVTKESPKDKKKIKKWKANGDRNERDWGRPSQKLEEGKPDMSHGDPMISLLKVLAAYWRKRFSITAPGLRKRGWSSIAALQKDLTSYKKEQHHPAKHGEKIESFDQFLSLAETSEGSRDVGAQLFTALLRAIGIEARSVASLQPTGYGFSKAEEMVPRKIVDPELPPVEDQKDNSADTDTNGKSRKITKTKPTKQSSRKGGKSKPIDLDSDEDRAITIDGSDEDSDSVIDVTPSAPKARAPKYDKDLPFPIYWTEAVSPITHKVFPVSAFFHENPVATSVETLAAFEPRGAKADKAHQVMAYVLAFSPDYSAKDVTIRYLRKKTWPGKTKGFRVPPEKVPVYDKHGRIKRHIEYDWFADALRVYRRGHKQRTAVDDIEDAEDLVPADPEKKPVVGDTLQSLKSSAEFVIERHLRREEALIPDAKPVRYFTVGKANKEEKLPVYSRTDVKRVMTAESWHKDGRVPREGEGPMKFAPVRAVTATRKREAEEHLLRTGEKQMQGLYSEDQTDWIIPPPIQGGKIPKNAYGNIDCFVPSMVPEGAVHLPYKGTVRICKKLEIDFAEAVVGFEFGNKMAVPVINGVVIAEENEKVVTDAWMSWNEEQQKKAAVKQEALILDTWRKMIMALRIRDRVQEDYGVELEKPSLSNGKTVDEPIEINDEEQAGGFLPEGHDHDEHHEEGGGFLIDHDEDRQVDDLTLEFHSASQENRKDQDRYDEIEVDNSQEYPTLLSSSASTHEESMDSDGEDDMSSVAHTSARPKGPSTVSGVARANARESIKQTSSKKQAAEIQKTRSAQTSVMAKTRGRPPKSTPTATKKKAISAPMRKTPARSAKARIQIIPPVDNEDDDNDRTESDEHSEDVSSASSDVDEVVPTVRRRGRPRKEPQPPRSIVNSATKGRRLLRKESTIVTSPYFEES